jgi:TolA-binding protein
MKHLHILAVLGIFCLVGCARQEKPIYTAPSVVAVKTSVEKVRQYVRPEGHAAVKELSDAITTYQKQVDDQSLALAKAQGDSVYWRNKQVKALKELWVWRGIALVSIVCVVGYIGIRTSWKFLV